MTQTDEWCVFVPKERIVNI